jgi:hypothetical protein
MNVPYPGSGYDAPPVLPPLPPHPQMMSRQTSAGSSDHGNPRTRAKVDVACDVCRSECLWQEQSITSYTGIQPALYFLLLLFSYHRL